MGANSHRYALLACVLLVGCADHDKPMTPQQMADAVAECKKHGLETESWRDFSINIVRITCSPK